MIFQEAVICDCLIWILGIDSGDGSMTFREWNRDAFRGVFGIMNYFIIGFLGKDFFAVVLDFGWRNNAGECFGCSI